MEKATKLRLGVQAIMAKVDFSPMNFIRTKMIRESVEFTVFSDMWIQRASLRKHQEYCRLKAQGKGDRFLKNFVFSNPLGNASLRLV